MIDGVFPPKAINPSLGELAAPDTTARNAFFNACRILLNLGSRELEAAGFAPSDRARFYDDPLIFLANLDDPSADALWAVIQRRQPERYRRI